MKRFAWKSLNAVAVLLVGGGVVTLGSGLAVYAYGVIPFAVAAVALGLAVGFGVRRGANLHSPNVEEGENGVCADPNAFTGPHDPLNGPDLYGSPTYWALHSGDAFNRRPG